MTRTTTSFRAAAVLSVAGLALLTTACSFEGKRQDSGPSPSASQAEAQEAPLSDQAGPTDAGKDKDGKQDAGNKPAPITDTKTVTAPQTGLTFAIPSDWKEISAETVASQDLASVAEDLGLSESSLKTQLQMIDLMVIDTSPENDFADNINVSMQVFPKSLTYDESSLTSVVQNLGATAGEYARVDTAVGQVHTITYTLPMGDKELSGAFLMVPNDDGDFSQLTVTTTKPENTRALMDTVLSSLS